MKHSVSLFLWTSFLTSTALVYFTLSNNSFSFLLVLSSLISAFGFIMVTVKVLMARSVAGVSLKMMEIYLAVHLLRLYAIVPYDGYLPVDATGDWFYQCVEGVSCLCAFLIIFFCRGAFRNTYDSSVDSTSQLMLVIPAIVMAYFFHPRLNRHEPSDIAWALSVYLEAVAYLPQLFLFRRAYLAQPFLSHFMAGQALSKVISYVFWQKVALQLNQLKDIFSPTVGVFVLGVQLVQVCIMAYFCYHYLRCLAKGRPLKFIFNFGEEV
uniref:ER lumen protein-retaining receptor n=1 Tax=Chromera velia CCMP2878 TaxID=1169474 RepID=A0A0G4FMG9_9ALVE|eukprot:Cvel_17722.t1-p1 / transcript=Cvel_17722.t1 / gene=Cvel_17722 / organism=Chromera_velia_CCMP2878 / gene_product=ER lumen protein retaining receptor 1, putative / transcript_product=ER lumen protein retaining receptor 1, putative / location=Cvel_scaffold1431:14103-14981(+) / protein_length=265 / sequence_SO=supercontig / SO=protein_coding / is_pseudo=false